MGAEDSELILKGLVQGLEALERVNVARRNEATELRGSSDNGVYPRRRDAGSRKRTGPARKGRQGTQSSKVAEGFIRLT